MSRYLLLAPLLAAGIGSGAMGQTIPESGRPASPAERRQLVDSNQRLARENQRIQRASERHRINYATLRSALAARLNVNRNVSDEQLIALVESTAREAASARSAIGELRTQVSISPDLRAEAEPAVARAQATFAAGRFDETRRSLAEVRLQRETAARSQQSSPAIVAWLNSIDAEVKVAVLQGDYTGASDLYLAAMREPGLNLPVRLRLAYLAADIFNRSAKFSGRDEQTQRAIEILRNIALPLVPREKYPVEWADTMNDIGLKLHNLGDSRRSKALFDEAEAAYWDAIAAYQEGKRMDQLAGPLINLANTKLRVGELERRPSDIEEAIRTYRVVQRTITREKAPQGWAVIQMNIGVALTELAEQAASAAHYREAVAAMRESLAITTFESAPELWADGQINLASALGALGRLTDDMKLLEEAVTADEASSRVWTRDRAPFRWASTRLHQAELAARIARARKDNAAVANMIASVREVRAVAVELSHTELMEEADQLLAELARPN